MSGELTSMPAGLRWTFRLLDWGMITYWSIISLGALAIITLPKSFMYDGYGTPVIDAWNWSFAPLDILFAVLGLASIQLERRQDSRWKALAIASLSLTFCAGLMAIGFWAIRGDFNPSWWIPNILLMILPIYWFFPLFAVPASNEPST